MSSKPNYKILSAIDIDRLAAKVIKARKKGYELAGGVAVDNDGILYQAVELPDLSSFKIEPTGSIIKVVDHEGKEYIYKLNIPWDTKTAEELDLKDS